MLNLKKAKGKKPSNIDKAAISLMVFGILLVGVGLVLFLLTFFPVIRQEVGYQLTFNKKLSVPRTSISPIDPEYSVVIPKIGANTAVVANVNPYNEKEYQRALTRGVAHAKGTVFPGQSGNVFLFAHSAGNWYEANRYNAIFYLLSKLKEGDSIYASYHKIIYRYVVKEIKYVGGNEVKYLSPDSPGKTLTLMTCWPPGTTLKRLVVVAEIAE